MIDVLKRAVIPVAIAGLLQGCGVGFGTPYEVAFENSSSITISFDPLLAGVGSVAATAQEHCARLGKDAVPEMVSAAGIVRQATFSCRLREIAPSQAKP